MDEREEIAADRGTHPGKLEMYEHRLTDIRRQVLWSMNGNIFEQRQQADRKMVIQLPPDLVFNRTTNLT